MPAPLLYDQPVKLSNSSARTPTHVPLVHIIEGQSEAIGRCNRLSPAVD
jgi:hypothetical protein